MNFLTLLTRTQPILKVLALLALSSGLASRAEAATISLDLFGMCPPSDFACVRDGARQLGAGGMYIGTYNNPSTRASRNWIWDGLRMEVDTVTGDASITGSMVSAISNPNNIRFGVTLGVDIQLTGMSFVGDAFSDDVPYDEMINDLIIGGDVGGYRNTQGIDALQWETISMSFTNESGFGRSGNEPNSIDWLGGNPDDDILLDGWEGMADTRYHCNGCVAELEMRDDGNGGKELHFGAWYHNPDGDDLYNFADTKVRAELVDEPPEKVPESSWVLGLLSAVGLGMLFRRRSQ